MPFGPQLRKLVVAVAFFAFAPAAPALAACPCTLFSDVAQPASQNLPVQDGRIGPGPWSYELGVKVTVDEPAQLTAIRFYKEATETGLHTGRVWTTAGTQLAQVDFTGETASGWQTQALAAPLTLQPGTVYIVSVNANATFGITGGGLATQVVSGPLRTVADGQNGVFGSAAGVFPNQSFNSTNYFIDLSVSLPAPTVTVVAPTSGATGVSTGAAVAATFSRAMDATTITGGGFTLRAADGTIVPAGVAYDATTNTATLTPTAALAAGATYTATVGTTVTAADGTPLAAAFTSSFTTQPPPPTVTAKTPGDGATGVALGATVSGTFSRSMNASTIDSSSFVLTGPSGSVNALVTYDATTQQAVLTPSLPLAYGTTYTAQIGATVASADGIALGAPVSWSFTTVPAPAPPTVTSTAPAGGASGVSTSAAVTATFSRAMDATTITTASFTLKAPDGTIVPGGVAYNTTTNTATVTPSAALVAGATYTASLAATIKAADGTPLAAAVTWSFTTAASTAPTVTAKSPVGGNVPVTAKVKVTFSRAMDATTITSASFTLTRTDDGAVPATVSYDATTNSATLTPSSPLPFAKTYSVTVAATIKASDGAALAAPVTWTFSTTDATRINSGGGAYTTSDGKTYLGDTFVSGGSTNSTSSPVTGTNDPVLEQTERWGQFTYSIPVPNGTYDVRLHFAELYYGTVVPGSCVGKRIFSMDILNTAVSPDLANLDICAQVGPNASLLQTVSGVSVTDGTLRIKSVYGAADDPELTAIEVVPAAAAPPPTGPPTVVAQTPASGATGAGTTAPIRASFSRAMDPSTITSASFTLNKTGDGAVGGTVSYDGTTNTATFTPSGPLAYSTSYTATLATTVKASDGTPLSAPVTWSFTTQDATRIDVGGPGYVTAAGKSFAADVDFSGGTTASTTSAISGTTDAALFQTERYGQFSYAIPVPNGTYDVRLSFAELYWGTTVPGSCVGKRVFGIDVLNTIASPDIANLDICAAVGPNAALVQTVAGVVVSDGVLRLQSVAGVDNPELTAIEVVPSGPAGTAPTVTKVTPAAGATGVANTSAVTATFSEAMNAATITASSFTLTPTAGASVPATVTYDATTNKATLTPSTPLVLGTTYTASLAGSVAAADGTALAPVSWTFTTVDAIRINSGDGADVTSSGLDFRADSFFTGGSTYETTSTISGTSDPELYQNERWGQFSYSIPLANGTYTVELHFVELYYGTAVPGSCVGKRIFGMDILQTPASPDIANLDICAAVGPNAALVKTITGVQVTGGKLDIQSVYGSADDPELAAIEVLPG